MSGAEGECSWTRLKILSENQTVYIFKKKSTSHQPLPSSYHFHIGVRRHTHYIHIFLRVRPRTQNCSDFHIWTQTCLPLVCNLHRSDVCLIRTLSRGRVSWLVTCKLRCFPRTHFSDLGPTYHHKTTSLHFFQNTNTF